MSEFFERTFFTILGGAVAGCIGVLISGHNRRRGAKDLFLVTVSDLRGKIVHGFDPLEFHKTSLERLREAVFRVRPFLRVKWKFALDATWREYGQIPANTLNKEESSQWVGDLHKLAGDDRFETPSVILARFFERFRQIAD